MHDLAVWGRVWSEVKINYNGHFLLKLSSACIWLLKKTKKQQRGHRESVIVQSDPVLSL